MNGLEGRDDAPTSSTITVGAGPKPGSGGRPGTTGMAVDVDGPGCGGRFIMECRISGTE